MENEVKNLTIEQAAIEYCNETKLGAFEEKYRVKVLDYVHEYTERDNLSMVNLSSFYKNHIDFPELKKDMIEIVKDMKDLDFHNELEAIQNTNQLETAQIKFAAIVNYDFQCNKCELNGIELQSPYKEIWGKETDSEYLDILDILIDKQIKNREAFMLFIEEFTRIDDNYDDLEFDFKPVRDFTNFEHKIEQIKLMYDAFDKKEDLLIYNRSYELGFSNYLPADELDDWMDYSIKVDFENKTINTYICEELCETYEYKYLVGVVRAALKQHESHSVINGISVKEEAMQEDIIDEIRHAALGLFIQEGYSQEQIKNIFDEVGETLPNDYAEEIKNNKGR